MFERELEGKIRANNKKKARRQKTEEERAIKLAAQTKANEEAARRVEEEKKRQAEVAAAERERKEREKARAERQAYLVQRETRRAELQAIYDHYESCVSEAQKKVKRLTKKLRDIEELEKKVSEAGEGFKPSKEQKAKLERRQEVEDDIAEAEEEEEVLLNRRQQGEFDELLQWVPDEPLAPDAEEDKDGTTQLHQSQTAPSNHVTGVHTTTAEPQPSSNGGCKSFADIAIGGLTPVVPSLPVITAPSVSTPGGTSSGSDPVVVTTKSEEEEWATVSKPNKKKNKPQKR